MYNRYIRNDNGVYERIPVQEPRDTQFPPPQENAGRDRPGGPPPRQDSSTGRGPGFLEGGQRGILDGLLGKLKLDSIDTGDLLLLAILFLLFREGGDEELLIALGLLLIL